MRPLISIIVPVYNVEPYLERCVHSILNQTYPNIEVILVDDGSPDKCWEICDKLALRDKRIKVIHKENGGVSKARNAGLDIAVGDLIGFVDSDDYIHPLFYDTLYKNMVDNNADLSMCDYKAVTDMSGNIYDFDNNVKVLNNIEALEMLLTYYCQIFVIVWNKLYRKEVFKDFRFEVGKIHEDEFISYKILHQSNRIAFSDARLYYYYQSPNSIIRSSFTEKSINYAEAIEDRLDYFNKFQLSDLYNQTLQRYCIWLLSFYYKNRSLMSRSFRRGMREKIRLYCSILIERGLTNTPRTAVYRLAIILPYPMGFVAHQSVFGLNLVSLIGRYLFDSEKMS
jgi:glycosyltransferase involved in cell wall biosynthesis